MWEKFLRVWKIKALRNNIFFVTAMLVIFRLAAHIPVPGINTENLRRFLEGNQILGLLNIFSGGSMENFSVVLMGVGPYITASIIFQLLIIILPRLEELQKEGEQGRQLINQYTRIATVPLAILQGYSTLILLRNQGIIGQFSSVELVSVLLTITGGTILLMWLRELISEYGIGHGGSMLITLGILTGLPTALSQTVAVIDQQGIASLLIFVVVAIAVTASIVFVNEGERQIPITYARRVRGLENSSGVATYLPLKDEEAGNPL